MAALAWINASLEAQQRWSNPPQLLSRGYACSLGKKEAMVYTPDMDGSMSAKYFKYILKLFNLKT